MDLSKLQSLRPMKKITKPSPRMGYVCEAQREIKKPSLCLSVNVDSVQNIATLALSLEYLKPEDGCLTETYLQRLVKYVPWTQLYIINPVSLEFRELLRRGRGKM